MGMAISGGPEEAPSVVSGTFTTAGQSAGIMMLGEFNASVNTASSFTGSVTLQRSFDGGTTWNNCSVDGTGTAATFTAPATVIVKEPEPCVYYRWNCTACTSGAIAYRLSGGQRVT